MPKNIENLVLEGSVNPVFFELETKNIAWTVIQNINGFHELFKSKPTPFRAPSVAMYAATAIAWALNRFVCWPRFGN